MEIQKKTQNKIMTRIRLINWHYFENETIGLNGTTLVSGENTAGKSTILDAIQLVLTTNTRKFNTAANEKGSRNLRGYVRCKIGNIGETYLRKNAVIANVALEFYEEKTDKYFILGVHMTSQDEESSVITKWYVEEGRFENLSFLNGNRPSLQNEFKNKGKKITFIDQKNAAKDRFKRRMGNLEDRFFDILPKSLAFKPMDNVKDFINKFVLSEESIDVESLRVNIETLSELEELMNKSKEKLGLLIEIVDKYQAIQEKDKAILVNELLLELAQMEALETDISEMESGIRKQNLYIESNEEKEIEISKAIADIEEHRMELTMAMHNNEAGKLAESIKKKLEEADRKRQEQKEQLKRLQTAHTNLKNLLRLLEKQNIQLITKDEFDDLLAPIERKKKINVFEKLNLAHKEEIEAIRDKKARNQVDMEAVTNEITELQQRISSLEKRNLQYPWYTVQLKEAIEKEFKNRGIDSRVYIVAELLEVTDETWQNAVEGYFNTQKFNLIVEPQNYKVALEVYHSRKDRIHTAGIVNTGKIQEYSSADNTSLAYVVHSDNRYAKAYANYVLGRVTRCANIYELENYPIAITADGMLYQGFVVRNLDKETYKNPYIGQNAYRVQLVNARTELEQKSLQRNQLREDSQILNDILEANNKVSLELMATYINAPFMVKESDNIMAELSDDLKKANNDPTYLELSIKLEKVNKEKEENDKTRVALGKEIGRLKAQLEQMEAELQKRRTDYRVVIDTHNARADGDVQCKLTAQDKYNSNRKTKTAKAVFENFSPWKARYSGERDELLNGNGGLKEKQDAFNYKFEQDFLRGVEGMREYIDARKQLEAVELIRFEEQMKKAKEDCEEVFKSDFLAKMKENIENARNEFKNLNKALQDIYYGDDSYHFLITFDKKKESLYRMIISENNQEGFNLWTEAFEAEYKEEMEELFDKLITKDDKGQKIIEEYTDYRSYLDYDIEIHKKNGTVQKFSDIYGEKSGSETQVPYYVAIAASFYQLYRLGNSIRIMMLDEAFDKMDDDRISSMMQFFNSLDLQVIMATPPSKIETIGEYVNTILTAIRVDKHSIVEEYDL